MFSLKLLSVRCALNVHGSKTHEVHEVYVPEAWMKFSAETIKNHASMNLRQDQFTFNKISRLSFSNQDHD
jgi:hypothetical protein